MSIQDTYLVFKTSDVMNKLSETERTTFMALAEKLLNDDKYYVVNHNEKYADKVKTIIQIGERKKLAVYDCTWCCAQGDCWLNMPDSKFSCTGKCESYEVDTPCQ